MKLKKILLCVICFVMLFTVTGCSKTATTTSSFKSTMEGKGFVVADVTSQYADTYVKEATVARKDDNYQIEFYLLDSEDSARNMFSKNKNSWESEADGSFSSKLETNIGNYNTLAITNNGKYKYLCRVDSTLIYLNVDEQYKDEVKKIIDELGY